MKKWYITFAGLVLTFALVVYTSFFVAQPAKEVNSFAFSKVAEGVSLQVVPNYDERFLDIKLDDKAGKSEGKLGGDFFDRFLDLSKEMKKVQLVETAGELKVKWDWVSPEVQDVDVATDKNALIEEFFDAVVGVMKEDIY